MEAKLKGKKALITGGGTGIGRAIALELAREGVHIAIASRNPHPETIEDIESQGVKAIWIPADVSKEKDVIKMVKDADALLKGLDLYINNAAAHWDEPVTKLTAEGWINSLNTNLSACVWACREISRHFIKQSSGSILIIGSTAMYSVMPKEASYRVSKAGLKPYMELLAVELAPFGIRANMLTPGLFPTKASEHVNEKSELFIKTIPLRKAGNLDKDIGPAAVFLLSDNLSGYTTGSESIIDGGLHINTSPMYTDEEIRNLNIQ